MRTRVIFMAGVAAFACARAASGSAEATAIFFRTLRLFIRLKAYIEQV